MRSRITLTLVYHTLAQLNRAVGTTKDQDDYILQGAYGGWQVQRRIPGGTSVTSVTTGYRSKREVYEAMYMMLFGISEREQQPKSQWWTGACPT